MPQSLAETYFHIVFSTKDRVPFLRDRALRNELHTYLGGACRHLKSPSLIVGGVEDHVHILCRFGRTITIADLLKGLKKESSKWIKGKDRSLHHRTESFKDEFRRLLKEHNAEYDER